MNRVLTIVGSSARAAAWSAVRAGFSVRAGDLFADVDLCRVSEATRVHEYPSGLMAVVGGSQTGAWMYTGALENHPSLIAAMARVRPLWGNSAAVLQGVRNPRLVAEALGRRGLACPQVTFDSHAVPRDGSWLSKPRLSAGGTGISFWTGRSPIAAGSTGHCFQQYVEGLACSAVYVAASGRAVLLGITRQLIGQPWTGASGFRYCGSVGPIELTPDATEGFQTIGNALAQEFSLVGLFGVDAIVNSRGVWPVEVNPRFTASVEILERAAGVRAIEWHVAACDKNRLLTRIAPPGGPINGKAIVFASSRLEVPAAWPELVRTSEQQAYPSMADIPTPGSTVEAGWPIVTVFAEGNDEAAVVETLRGQAAGVLQAAKQRNF